MDHIHLLKNLLWDYDISPQECYKVLMGEQERAGHYDQSHLFEKLLESYPWFIIIEILPLMRIKELLTQETIHRLRSKKLQKRYEFILERL